MIEITMDFLGAQTQFLPRPGAGSFKRVLGSFASAKRGYDLYRTYQVPIESVQVFCRDPVLQMDARADRVGLVLGQKPLVHREARDVTDVTGAGILSVPIARDLRRVRFGGHGIEDGLVRKARRERTVAGSGNEVE